MMDESVSSQEPVWPQGEQGQVLQRFQERGREWRGPQKKRAGRPASISWSPRCLAMMLCLLRGWNAQWDVWRLRCSEQRGGFAPVQVCDQAISHRIARAGTSLPWLFEHVSVWLRTRLAPWEDRRLAPWATAVSAADASTLDPLSRFLPWLRQLSGGDTRFLAGQMSALFAVRLPPWVRVDCWPAAGAHGMAHMLTLGERVQAGALVLCDRGSFRFAFFDPLSCQGMWWIRRDARQASAHVSHLCSQADGVLDAIVSLGTASDHQARSPVRLIPFWLHGRHDRSLTNGRDPHVFPRADVVGFDARRWESERAFRALKDHLHLHQVWRATWAVAHVQWWCCLILAHVSHARQIEIAGQAGVAVCEGSLDWLVRLAPGWLSRGLTPLEYAVRFGRDRGWLRPSTRSRIEVPWIAPTWVVPLLLRQCSLGRGAATVPKPKAQDPRALASFASKLAHSICWSRCDQGSGVYPKDRKSPSYRSPPLPSAESPGALASLSLSSHRERQKRQNG
jgi:hypothetical protein